MKRQQQSTISNGVRRVWQIQSGIGRYSEKNLASTAKSTSPLISRGEPNYCLEPVDFLLTVLFLLLHSVFPAWGPSHNPFLPHTFKKKKKTNPTILKLSSLPLQSENKVIRKCQGLEPGCFCCHFGLCFARNLSIGRLQKPGISGDHIQLLFSNILKWTASCKEFLNTY